MNSNPHGHAAAGGNPYLSKYYIGRSHSECLCDSDWSVFYINEALGIHKQIIDRDGNICNFPGIENCEALAAEIRTEKVLPIVRFSASFRKLQNGQHRMVWTIRPDGRFWMDSWGFGAEDYDWVDLYSYIDENGQFTAPFKLYSIGYQTFAEDDEAL